MKTRKQWIAMLLMFAMLFTALPIAAFAEDEPEAPAAQEQKEKPTPQKEENTGNAAMKPMQAPGEPSEEETPNPPMKRLFIDPDFALIKGKGHTHPGAPDQISSELAEMFQNLDITITDGKTTWSVPKKFINHKLEEVSDRIFRDGHEWPVGTELTITIDTSGIKEPYHISYSDLKSFDHEGWITEAGYYSFKFKITDLDDRRGKTDMPLRVPFGRMDVKFDPQEGNWDGDKEAITNPVKNDNTVEFPAEPKKDGLHFAGWYTQFPKEQPVPGQISVRPENLGKRVFWTANEKYSDYDRDSKMYNDPKVDPLNDWIFLLRALWQAHVVFDTDGGSPVDRVEVDEGDTLKAPKDPTKSGYRFAGWLGPDGKPYDFKAPVKGDMTLKAQWKEAPTPSAEYVKVVFDANEGVWNDGTTKAKEYTVKAGNEITLPEAPTREGYKFIGWGDGYKPGDKYVVPAGGHTFVAQWEKDEKKPEEKPSVDSKIKTPRGSALTPEEIAKILAGMKKTVPAIPRAGVGR